MRSKGLTLQIIQLLITVIILYTITAIVPRLISTYLKTYFYLAVLALCVLLVMVSRGRSSIDEYVILIIPFAIWKVIIYFVDKPSVIDWGYSALLDFIPIILGLFITKRLDKKYIKYFSVVIILAVVVTAITTYIGLVENPDAARYIATVSDPNESKYVRYNMMNIGGYNFIYNTVLLYPLAVYAYKRGKIKTIVAVIIAVAEMLLTIQSGYTTAFLLWMLSTAFFFFNRDFKAKYLVAVIIIAVLIFLVLFELISQGFRSLAEIIDNKTISERLIDLAGGKRGLEQSEDPRLELYMMSINTFFAHPIFGSMGGGIGGHSFFLDNLGKYGLFGVVLFVPMYVVIYRKFYAPYRNTTGNGFIIWMFIQTLILSLVNTGMWLYVLCFFIPTILSFINKGEKKIEGPVGRKLNT